MKLRIREATEADFSAIHELMRQVHQLHLESRPDIYQDIDPLTEEYYHTMLSDSTVLLALDGEKTAGFCVFQIRPTFANPLLIPRKVAFMDDLCVHEDYRRKGIGKQLFEAACQMAREDRAETLELMVWSFNQNAVRFYEELGMTAKTLTMELRL